MIEVQGKQIATAKILIKDLFAEDMWYNIPNYQRPYVWGEEQISNLIDDVNHASLNTPESQYFLGSVVLHCQDKTLNDTPYTENSLLDGQQRLTTLYLLHAVVRDLTDKPIRKSVCKKVIFDEGNSDYGLPERIRLEFSIREEVAKFISDFIKEEGGTNEKEKLEELSENASDISVKNMAKAVLILRDLLSNKEQVDINTFFPYLSTKVILVYVASKELEDAFRLFTVLNDRGIKLRNSDILKAQNLKEVEGEKGQLEYAKLWESLESELEEDFDKFLSYIRTILVKEKARHNLLKEFEDNIYYPTKFNKTTKKREPKPPLLKKGEETFELVRKYKGHYDKIFSSNNYNNLGSFAFDNLISLLEDTATSDIWTPPILAYRECFGEEMIFEFLKKLDNKFSADWICRLTPTSRIENMNSIIAEIEKASNLEGDSNSEKINHLINADCFEYDYDELIEIIDGSHVYRKSYDRYLLRKVDFLWGAPNFAEKRDSYKLMSVEHILPQNPAADSQWMIDFEEDEVRADWTDAIGNLVLISRRKNSAQGRLDFTLKKEKYFEKNIETFPNSLKVMQNSSWEYEDLEKHQKEVLALFKNWYKI